jgi:molybdate transport system substrate-binding protein
MLRRALACAAVIALTTAVTEFTVPPVDQVLDLHGDPQRAQLVIFAAGNQYMAMPRLLSLFRRRDPAVRSIFYETLPPGILLRQIQSGTLRVGNLAVTARADVVLFGPRGMRRLRRDGVVSAWSPYASNTLAILVRAGDPLHIKTLADLGRAGVRVVMPNPAWEGVAEQVEGAYALAGGKNLVSAIMVTKLAAGTTLLTHIHHRETPLLLREGRADAGPVWLSEAVYQSRLGGVQMLRIPASQNVSTVYDAAAVQACAHRAAAEAFVRFIQTPEARAIFRSYGFGPPR